MTATCPLPIATVVSGDRIDLHRCGAPLVVAVDVVAEIDDHDQQVSDWRIVCTSGHRMLTSSGPMMPVDMGELVGRVATALDVYEPAPYPGPATCARCREPMTDQRPACSEAHDEPRHLGCCGHGSAILAAHTRGEHLMAKLIECPGCRAGW